MEMMVLMVADHASFDEDRKLNIIGSFNEIRASAFPAVHPRMVIVTRLSAAPAEANSQRKLTVKIIDEDGKTELLNYTREITVGEPPAPPQSDLSSRSPRHPMNDSINKKAIATAQLLANRPYTTNFRQDETTDGTPIFVAECPELQGCMAQGWTIPEANLNLADARVDYIASLLEDGLPVPIPEIQRQRTVGATDTFTDDVDPVRAAATSGRPGDAPNKPAEPIDPRTALPQVVPQR